jgi:alpha-L-fucosidase
LLKRIFGHAYLSNAADTVLAALSKSLLAKAVPSEACRRFSRPSLSALTRSILVAESYTNFILNCPPNRDGQLDAAIVTLLGQVGSSWTPSANRALLPAQTPLNEHPYMPAGATASSGTASSAIDGVNDVGNNTVWTSSASLPQSLTLDLGAVKPDVGYFGYLPGYAGNGPTTNGNITSYKILVSSDNTTYATATSGTWPADGKYKGVVFGPLAARYIRLEADAVNGTGGAQATEVVVGARR